MNSDRSHLRGRHRVPGLTAAFRRVCGFFFFFPTSSSSSSFNHSCDDFGRSLLFRVYNRKSHNDPNDFLLSLIGSFPPRGNERYGREKKEIIT